MNYYQSVNLLTSQAKFHINLGLDRIKKLLALLDNPQDKFKSIHIAGTNGKGSVCATLANILTHSGYKTALYTSPHLINYTERIKINNTEISKTHFAELIQQICNIADNNNIDLTEFEILTAVAFKYFADNNVDFAIIETGLGGRLDATNIIKSPLCSVITSISLDHTNILGDSIDKIALEKAGIIKPNSTAIISTKNPGFSQISNYTKNIGANLISVKNDIPISFENNTNYALINNTKYEFPLLGLYQKQNLALVIATTQFLQEQKFKISLSQGLKTVKWPARLEFIKQKNLLIDGAHNPSAATELKKSLDFYFPDIKRIFIYGTINTKDYLTIAKILFTPDDEIYYYEFNHKNAVSFEEYKQNLPSLNLKPFNPEILNRTELKILTGSLYMIGDFININAY